MVKKEVERQATVGGALTKINTMIQDVNENYLMDTSNAVAVMAQAILDADTFEGMFNAAGLEPTADLFDIGLLVEEVTFNESTYEVGLPFYATFRGRKVETGEAFVCNCGAWQTVVVAYKMVKNNWLPRNVVFHRNETPTKAGFHPINILPWEEPF